MASNASGDKSGLEPRTPDSGAAGTGYTPANPGDWSPPPTTVAGALDQLAARVKALEAGGSGTYTAAAANVGTGIFAVYLKTAGSFDLPDNSQAQQDLVFGLAVGPWGNGASVRVYKSGQRVPTAPAKTGKLFSLPGGVLGNLADLTPGDFTKVVGSGDTGGVEVLMAAESFGA